MVRRIRFAPTALLRQLLMHASRLQEVAATIGGYTLTAGFADPTNPAQWLEI
jgi:hypothetical protein